MVLKCTFPRVQDLLKISVLKSPHHEAKIIILITMTIIASYDKRYYSWIASFDEMISGSRSASGEELQL